jgi:hypothetical protein
VSRCSRDVSIHEGVVFIYEDVMYEDDVVVFEHEDGFYEDDHLVFEADATAFIAETFPLGDFPVSLVSLLDVESKDRFARLVRLCAYDADVVASIGGRS